MFRRSALQLARLEERDREKGKERKEEIKFHFVWIFLRYNPLLLEEKNLNYVIPRVNQTGSKGSGQGAVI